MLGVALMILCFVTPYVLLMIYITDPIHDYFFLSHTKMVDEELEYNGFIWRILGNTWALITTIFRCYIGYMTAKVFASIYEKHSPLK